MGTSWDPVDPRAQEPEGRGFESRPRYLTEPLLTQGFRRSRASARARLGTECGDKSRDSPRDHDGT
jgi:hypothetical protein